MARLGKARLGEAGQDKASEASVTKKTGASFFVIPVAHHFINTVFCLLLA